MTQVAPANHEADVHLYYAPTDSHPNALVDYDGLDPYWTVATFLVDVADGYHEIDIEIDGEPATVRLTYSKSGIRPHREHDVDADRLYEFDVNVRLDGQRKVNYNLSPRFQDMRTTDGDPISTPWDHTDQESGVSVRCQSSNVELDDLPTFLPRALHELFESLDETLYTGYFQRPFDGRVAALERYVRIRREMNEKLVGTGGVFDRLSTLLSDQAGTKGEYKWNNEKTKGHHHVVRHDSLAANMLVSTHRHGGEVKSYLPEHPEEFKPDDPLYHPKVGTKFVAGRDDRGAVDWSDRHDLVDELDERLLSLLQWGDVPVEAGGTTYVADDHFRAGAADSAVPLHSNPLPNLEAEQEHLLVTALRDMTDADQEMLRTLVTDGGQDVHELADRHERGLSTVYRMLDRFDEVLRNDNGHVRFTSQKLRTELQGILESVEDHVATAADRVADLVDFDVRQRASSAFDRWLSKYAGEFDAPADDGRLTVRIDTVLSRYKSTDAPLLSDVLDEMLRAWRTDSRDPRKLLEARYVARVDGDDEEGIVRATR